jgi:hypothetical protein
VDASVIQIVGSLENKPYTYEARDSHVPKTEQVATTGETLHYILPAQSFTQIAVRVKE